MTLKEAVMSWPAWSVTVALIVEGMALEDQVRI